MLVTMVDKIRKVYRILVTSNLNSPKTEQRKSFLIVETANTNFKV